MNKQEIAKIAERNKEIEKRANTDWNAKYFREKSEAWKNSINYIPSGSAVEIKMKKSEQKKQFKAAIEAAKKVRHNPAAKPALAPFVMINGVPHKRTADGYKAMTPIAESKKWELA
jgi:hypothetical protein